MTQKLEDLFNIGPSNIVGPETIPEALAEAKVNADADITPDIEAELDAEVAEVQAIHALQATSEAVDKVEAALPLVRGLEASDAEMDSLADLAENTFKDLMDLGMNVDVRSAPRIFEVAGTMLGHAITAKTAKLDKKLKMIDLQLKKQKLNNDNGNVPQAIEGKGTAMTRNELLEQVLKAAKQAK
jgi:predicted GNAT family acetyltransferase